MTRKYNAWAGNPEGTPEDITKCIESVSTNDRSMIFYQCNRKRGFGKDGLYCKQHAKQHPDPNTEFKIGYISYYNYGPILTKVKIISETKKRATVFILDNIIGRSYFNNTISKDKYPMFDNEEDARIHLRNLINRKIHSHQNKIKSLQKELERI